MSPHRAAALSPVDTDDVPLNVAARGDKVLILGRDHLHVVLSIEAARRSARRLLDAVAIAEGHAPTEG